MNKTNNATAHYIKSTGNRTIWLNYISAEMTSHKTAPRNTRIEEENYHWHRTVSQWCQRSESVCTTVYGNKPWSKMIGLLNENQFQLKMMGLKDTFSWEILHPSWFVLQTLPLPLSHSQCLVPFLLDFPKLQWRCFLFWIGREKRILRQWEIG